MPWGEGTQRAFDSLHVYDAGGKLVAHIDGAGNATFQTVTVKVGRLRRMWRRMFRKNRPQVGENPEK